MQAIPSTEKQHTYQSWTSGEWDLHELSLFDDILDRKQIMVKEFLNIEGALESNSYDSIVQAVDNRVGTTYQTRIRHIQSRALDATQEVLSMKGCLQSGVL